MEQALEVVTAFDQATWESRLKQLARRDGDIRWELGDCLLEGLPHMPPTAPEIIHGYNVSPPDAYSVAEAITGFSRRHLIDLASTAKRSPASVRTDALTWSHHRALVNELPDAGEATLLEWRDRAVAEGLSVAGLKAAINETSYTPAKLEKSFIVKVPLGVWEILKDFADYEEIPVQQVAARWLREHSELIETQMLRDLARREVKDRRLKVRQKQGKALARTYPLPQNR